jgi:hypothetical protein
LRKQRLFVFEMIGGSRVPNLGALSDGTDRYGFNALLIENLQRSAQERLSKITMVIGFHFSTVTLIYIDNVYIE